MKKQRNECVPTVQNALATLLALAVGPLSASAAQAEDRDWTGFHAGLNAGQTRGDAEAEVALSGQWNGYPGAAQVAQALDGDGRVSGSGVGLQIGYDRQFANGWVLGVEADYQQLGADGTTTRTASVQGGGEDPSANVRATTSTELRRAYSLRSRIGYAAGRTLWYATVGYASSSADLRSEFQYAIPETSSDFRKVGSGSASSSGVIWGAGVDWRFAEHWSAGLRYTRVGGAAEASYSPVTVARSGQFTVQPPEAFVERIDRRVDRDALVLSVDYRF